MTTPKTITMANRRRSGGDAFMDVATNRTRYVVTSHRRPLVAVVPLEDLERLEAMDRVVPMTEEQEDEAAHIILGDLEALGRREGERFTTEGTALGDHLRSKSSE